MVDTARVGGRRGAILAVALTLTIGLIVIVIFLRVFPKTKSIPELFNQPISSAEIIEYPYGSQPETVTRTTITDPEIIARISRPFDQMPVTRFGGDLSSLVGKTVTNIRFYPEDGEPIDTMIVFVDNYDSVVFWTDGSVNRTKWGRPYDGFFNDYGIVQDIPFSEAIRDGLFANQ